MNYLKYLQLVVVVLGILFNPNQYCSSALVWSRNPDLDGRILLNEIQVLTVQRVACATACTRHPDCVSFVYDGSKINCWLFDKIYRGTGSSTILSPYAQYYQSTKGPLRPAYCPDAYTYSKSICFKPEVHHISWISAQQVCLSEGGNLLVPDSERKNTVITEYLDKDIVYYMGIHYIYSMDMFEAVDGRTPSEINYSNWSPDQFMHIIDNSNQCGALKANSTGYFQWHSIMCSGSPGSICEITK